LAWWNLTCGCVEGEVALASEAPTLASPELTATDVFTFE